MTTQTRQIPQWGLPLIETHCHLDYLKAASAAELIAEARRVGVERIITIAVSPDNQSTVLALADAHPEVWTTQGIHPHDAHRMDEATAVAILEGLRHPRVVAVGECGLDYHYEHSPRDVQRRVFEQQLAWAIDADLPVVIHTREADEDTRAMLANVSGRLKRGGVIHSFTSSLALAEFCLDEGFCLGFNGICTFNKADNVREVVAITPLDRILLETDAPYLTPIPFRGRENAPHYLPCVAAKVAEVKQVPAETVLRHAYDNSLRTFFPA